jgi:hypothetical protein
MEMRRKRKVFSINFLQTLRLTISYLHFEASDNCKKVGKLTKKNVSLYLSSMP